MSSLEVTAQSPPSWLAPSPPSFPHFDNRDTVIEEAQRISNDLEAYVEAWLAGDTPAQLPAKLIPPGVDTEEFGNFRLVRPENIADDEQWAVRPAETINLNATRGYFPDPNATYTNSLDTGYR